MQLLNLLDWEGQTSGGRLVRQFSRSYVNFRSRPVAPLRSGPKLALKEVCIPSGKTVIETGQPARQILNAGVPRYSNYFLQGLFILQFVGIIMSRASILASVRVPSLVFSSAYLTSRPLSRVRVRM